MHLNCSNGCRQLRHWRSDLQGVEPNSLRSSVSGESQCGHCVEPGGAMPAALSFCFVSSLSQSVVHGGEKEGCTSTFGNPFSRRKETMFSRIVYVAGQPKYVGVIVTRSRSPSSWASRTD